MNFLLIFFISSQIFDNQGVLFDDNTKETLILAPPELKSYIIPRETTTIKGGSKESGPFYPCRENLKSLSFEEGSNLANVEPYCFAYLTGLIYFDLRYCVKLKYLSNCMFLSCKNIQYLILPPNIENIRTGSISGTSVSNLTIPASVLRIENYDNTYYSGAINSNANLKQIIWEKDSKITYIGSVGFQSNALTSFTIPKYVTTLGSEAITNNKLQSITVEAGNTMFYSDGVFLLDKTLTKILACPNELNTCPPIPKNVTTLGDASFQATKISNMVVPEGIVIIEANSFSRSSLVSISISSTVTSIGSRSFWYCPYLTNIKIESTKLTTISDRLFLDCNNLQEVIIPYGVTTIKYSAFEGCSKIKYIFVPNTTTTIEKAVFARINNDVNIEFQPKSNFSIQNLILYNYNRTELIAFFGSSGDNLNAVIDWRTQTIRESAFQGTNLKKIEFPSNSSLTKIESLALSGTQIETIQAPSQVTVIEDEAFLNCKKLNTIKLCNSIQQIGIGAFSGTAISRISIPKSTKRIQSKAFKNCTVLDTVTFENSDETLLTELGDECFANTAILSVTVPYQTTVLGVSLFSGSSLKSIYFEGNSLGASTLKNIGSKVFMNCKNLDKIDFGSCIGSIGQQCFEGCSELKKIDLDSSITEIGIQSFKNCVNLATVKFSENFKTIGAQSFSGCSSLTHFDIPSNSRYVFKDSCLMDSQMTEIHVYAYGSPQASLTVREMVSSIIAYSFEGAGNLEEVRLGGCRITEIGYGAFRGCGSLSRFELPVHLDRIGQSAFADCTSLTCGSFVFVQGADTEAQRALLLAQGIDESIVYPCPTLFFTRAVHSSWLWLEVCAQPATVDGGVE